MKATTIFLLLIFSQPLLAKMSMEEKLKLLQSKLSAKSSKKESQAKSIYLPLKVNQILHDEVFVKIDKHEHLFVNQETIEYLRSLIKKSYQKKFQPTVDENGFTELKELEILDINASYDSKNILLNITLPPAIKRASTIDFSQKRKRDINGSTLPEPYSGGINFYMNQQYDQSIAGKLQKSSINLSSDIFLNIDNFVIEGELYYTQEEGELNRGAFRMVKDDGNNLLRYQLGDISLPTHNRLSYINALGIAVEKNFNLGSSYNQNTTRINSHEFFIKKRSQVEIYVNNRYRNSLNLLAGTHNLFDLNLPSGLNHVKLKVIENGGKIEYIEFNDFSYSEVLKKGLLIYGGGMGIESDEGTDGWNYNKNNYISSAYIEYGLLDDITIEGGFQSGNNLLSTDIELLIGTNYGLFNPYLIANKSDDKWGYKRGLEYKGNIKELHINLLYEESDSNFQDSSNLLKEDSQLYRGNFHYLLGQGINMGLSLSSYKEGDRREENQALVLRKNFDALSTEFTLEEQQIDGDSQSQLSFTLEYRFGEYSSRYDNYISEKKEQLNLKYHSSQRYGFNGELTLEKSEQRDNYNIRADINNEKFRVNSNYNLSKSNYGENQNLGLQLATGMVFAGEHATITAPITSSFVIVDNDDRLEKPLGIQNYQDIDEFVYDSFAIELSDYEEREFVVEESNLDFGIDLEKFQEKFISNYKSGSVMEVNVQNFYSVKGVFYDDRTKKPLAGKAFKIFNLQTGEKSRSFTNDQGAFTINHVGVGKYNISFMQENQYKGISRYTFTIDEQQKESLMDMGKIYIKTPEKKEIKKLLVYTQESNQTIDENLKKVLNVLYFKKEEYRLSEKDREKLMPLADAISHSPKLKLDIIGYPDINGFEHGEMDIAYKRAKSVESFLLEQGVLPSQLNTLGRQRGKDAKSDELGKVRFQIKSSK
jgi:outer membrane usher protein